MEGSCEWQEREGEGKREAVSGRREKVRGGGGGKL